MACGLAERDGDVFGEELLRGVAVAVVRGVAEGSAATARCADAGPDCIRASTTPVTRARHVKSTAAVAARPENLAAPAEVVHVTRLLSVPTGVGLP
ncbi:hypothetical protein [Streptomyces mirabilis]|uniref:hypothetical protein n=1 Tax=Streptomyces mirabilis TaxID=68239 RepID=UPI00340B8EA9